MTSVYNLIILSSLQALPDKQLQESVVPFQQICQWLHELFQKFCLYYSIDLESEVMTKKISDF